MIDSDYPEKKYEDCHPPCVRLLMDIKDQADASWDELGDGHGDDERLDDLLPQIATLILEYEASPLQVPREMLLIEVMNTLRMMVMQPETMEGCF